MSGSRPPPVIEARTISYGVRGAMLVKGASLALRPGQLTVIIGPNGAGKSTLLRLLSGEIAPHSGEVVTLGLPLRAIPAWRLAARRVVMAQASGINFPFIVHEVVRLGLEGIGRAKLRDQIERMVEDALAAADVLSLAGRDYQSLSGGEQQRVQFARAIAQLVAGRSTEPVQAMLLDEPIASLDLCHQLGLLDAARGQVRAGAVAGLAVLHDLNLAATYADHLVVMNRGGIVAAGAPADILTRDLVRAVFQVELAEDGAHLPRIPVILPQFCKRSPTLADEMR